MYVSEIHTGRVSLLINEVGIMKYKMTLQNFVVDFQAGAGGAGVESADIINDISLNIFPSFHIS